MSNTMQHDHELDRPATYRELLEVKTELARDIRAAVKAMSEEFRTHFGALDDKYGDLPGRVRNLEDAVFPSPPRARRRRLP